MAGVQYQDLIDVIDAQSLECLNERPDRGINRIFPPSGSLLESDADEQLLINVSFKQNVKLFSLEFVAPDDGRKPNTVKLFVNNRQVDFGDAEAAPGTQLERLAWTPHGDGRARAVLQTRFVKFQDVTSVSIFIQDNEGADTSALGGITLTGLVLSDFNMKNLKKAG
eukprot:TRINITY_DN5347_c0_g1_i1.p1 TRINITY_DN5347_c0_g1~~TRINITY_DN5347_c0_g1_i1.p1  ORF type:complete len:167 (-),score=58.58 TRINITY_DN5347_c0_g1_i1:408-908(-)